MNKMPEYTKGEWEAVLPSVMSDWKIEANNKYIAVVFPTEQDSEEQANAHLIAAAPKGYELAEFVSRISATWLEEGLLEIGEGDYTKMKELALDFLAKARRRK